VRVPEQQDPGRQEDPVYRPDTAQPEEKQRRDDISQAGTAKRLRMVYEDELRKVCGGRVIDKQQQRLWMSIRKSLPISRWIERTRDRQPGKPEQKDLRAELERFLGIFAGEARQGGLELDMERNYYREAVSLLNKYRRGETPGESDRQRLRELMIMVDYKDARLAIQILQSII